MKYRILLVTALLMLLSAKPAAAENRFIVRSNLGSQLLSNLCLLQGCTVVRALDGTLNQVFLLVAPDLVNPAVLLNLLRATPGILRAELDQLVPLGGGQNQVTTPPVGLSDRTPVSYYGASVWDGYANQPAALIVRSAESHSSFHVAGAGIVADIDTGVDPTHPALQAVLLPGYDFTRNQPNGSELTDFTEPTPSGNSPAAAQVNQSTAAVLDQSTAAVLDGNVQYAAFGHGTMVMGVIHLVAPQARLMPLKAFHADGSASLADILSAVYYAVQNNANVINMSFDLKTNSQELAAAISYANQLNVICVASAGNDGKREIVYPAAQASAVMGVASTTDLDTRSTFSNFGNAVVWVAAPGEAVITTYPFGTYAAGWGTSFSAPLVSGTAALLVGFQDNPNQAHAAAAIANAQFVGPDMGNGRLDIYQTLQSVHPVSGPADFTVSASPGSQTIDAGQATSFTVVVAPTGGFNQTVTWTCSGAPAGATCSVSPTSTALDGSTSANVTVNIQTASHSNAMSPVSPGFASPHSVAALPCLLWIAVIMVIWQLNRAGVLAKRTSLAPAVVLLMAGFCASCGGGTGMQPPTQPPRGAPPTVSTITVTGTSGGVSHAATVQLTVN